MNDNPYAPPVANVESRFDVSARTKIYSPTQAAAGAFLGGPIGLIYFLQANFVALQNPRLRRMTLVGGAAMLVALIAILPMLPENFPSAVITIGYIVVARQVAERFQMTKQAIAESPHHQFQSNARVFWLSLLCLLGSIVVIMGPLLVLVALGIWRP